MPRFQFSLRVLLALLALFAVAFAFLAVKAAEKRRQREVVRFIESLGGTVSYDWQPMYADPPGSKWSRALLGDDFFARITWACCGDAASDADLETITMLNDIEKLYVGSPVQNAKLTDDGLPYLKRLRKLKKLVLYRPNVTVAGIADLQDSLPDCEIVWFR